eukprot:TRINITY_DN28136_c0_g1_i1.p1 TRINITY_DN28136_c0_g1~~TRINITY_DN28136_c0_g1_i1.p1  ORF type:complete len:247 (+),score=39.36 TRINITY_DN28136_c0_g1_i1:51-743(+)
MAAAVPPRLREPRTAEKKPLALSLDDDEPSPCSATFSIHTPAGMATAGGYAGPNGDALSRHFIGTPSATGILNAFLDCDDTDTRGPPLDPDFDSLNTLGFATPGAKGVDACGLSSPAGGSVHGTSSCSTSPGTPNNLNALEVPERWEEGCRWSTPAEALRSNSADALEEEGKSLANSTLEFKWATIAQALCESRRRVARPESLQVQDGSDGEYEDDFEAPSGSDSEKGSS